MGFFKKLGKSIKKIVKDPLRLTLAVSTIGGSELARQIPGVKKVLTAASPVVSPVLGAVANKFTYGGYGVTTGLVNNLVGNNRPLPTVSGTQIGGNPMAFNLGGLLGQVGTIFGGNQNSIFQGVSNVANLASNFFPPRGVPQGGPVTVVPQAMPVAAARPALGALATVGRSFFNKYPNLATAIQMYRNQGKHVTRAKLWSLVKRFGPEIVISGGILSAAAVNELMVAGAGHRRMNPANVKALRRSLRRLESFHTLCQKVDKLRRPRSRSKSKSGSGSTFVRQG